LQSAWYADMWMMLRPLQRHMEAVEAVQSPDGEDLRRMTIVNGLEGALLAPGLCVPQQMADAGRSKYTCSKVLSQLFKTDIYDKKITIHLNDVHQYIDSIRTSF